MVQRDWSARERVTFFGDRNFCVVLSDLRKDAMHKTVMDKTLDGVCPGGGRRARTFKVKLSCRAESGIRLICGRSCGIGVAVATGEMSLHGQ